MTMTSLIKEVLLSDGKRENVRASLERGDDINAKSSTGQTAASYAAQYGNYALLHELLLHKPTLNETDNRNKTPLDYATEILRDTLGRYNLQSLEAYLLTISLLLINEASFNEIQFETHLKISVNDHPSYLFCLAMLAEDRQEIDVACEYYRHYLSRVEYPNSKLIEYYLPVIKFVRDRLFYLDRDEQNYIEDKALTDAATPSTYLRIIKETKDFKKKYKPTKDKMTRNRMTAYYSSCSQTYGQTNVHFFFKLRNVCSHKLSLSKGNHYPELNDRTNILQIIKSDYPNLFVNRCIETMDSNELSCNTSGRKNS